MAKTKPTAVMDQPDQIEIGLPGTVPAAAIPVHPAPPVDPLPVLRSRVDPADTIDPRGRYTTKDLEGLLGIDAKQIAHQLETAGIFLELFGASSLQNSPNGLVAGSSVRAWLRKCRPECRIPCGVGPANLSKPAPGRMNHPTITPAVVPEREPRTAGEKLACQLRDNAAAEQAADEADQAEIWRALVPLLAKGDDRTDGDVERMVELCNDLGLDAHTLGQAQDAIADLTRLREVAGQRQELLRKSYDLNIAYRRLRDRKDEELEAARKAARQATANAQLASESIDKINDLRRRWPMLFATE